MPDIIEGGSFPDSGVLGYIKFRLFDLAGKKSWQWIKICRDYSREFRTIPRIGFSVRIKLSLMPSKLSSDSFIAVVRQSGLLEPGQLTRFWQRLQDSGLSLNDPSFVGQQMVTENLLTKWQVDKLLQGKHKGFFLGNYKLISLLGAGGMSSVYLAEHTVMRRRVAIKVLPSSRIPDSSYLQRFHREAQAVAALDHPNIMRAYDVDHEGNLHFLVMEYIEGRSLLEMVHQDGPLGFTLVMDIIRQTAEGLAHAHDKGMIHRDIKPGNLLMDKQGVLKILDMGLAVFFNPQTFEDAGESSSLTEEHDDKVLGTADYLSPEQALDSHSVDIRTDIYSLGCTLYYVLVGHPPFPEGTLAQRLLAHQTREPESILNLRPEIPQSLVAILTKMMRKKPDERYQTALELRDATLNWLVENGDEAWRKQNPNLARQAAKPVPTAKPVTMVPPPAYYPQMPGMPPGMYPPGMPQYPGYYPGQPAPYQAPPAGMVIPPGVQAPPLQSLPQPVTQPVAAVPLQPTPPAMPVTPVVVAPPAPPATPPVVVQAPTPPVIAPAVVIPQVMIPTAEPEQDQVP